MGPTTKTLGDLLDYLDQEQLQLPEIQREFVWSKNSIKPLFDSLYRKMPIGQMLVWKPKSGVPRSKGFYGKRQPRSAAAIDSFYGYLLDGQQRLTAISRVKELDEKYPLRVNLRPQKEPDEELFSWRGVRVKDEVWHPRVGDVLAPDFKVTSYLEQLKKHEAFNPSDEEVVHDMILNLRDILKYPISVTEFESDDYREATDLFIRFNSTGTRLNKSDLALSELATRVEGLTSIKMNKLLSKWKPAFRFTAPFLIQCLVAVHTHRMDLRKPKKVWGNSTPKEIDQSWGKMARGLDSVIELLTGTVRWQSDSWIPSFNALIPLVYVLAYGGALSLSERKLARSWLLLTGVHAYFSGAVQTQLDQLLRKLKKEPSMEKLWNVTYKKLPQLQPEDFQGMRHNSPVMSLFVSLLRENDARDWVNDTPLDGTVLGHNAKLHVHHFFPRALLSKHKYESSWINTFSNYTLLSAATNFDVYTEEPATYLKRIQYDRKQLTAQCIPLDPKLWHVTRYEEFLAKREQLLAKKVNEFLGSN